MSGNLEFHPLAELFPLLSGAEFGELVEDIKAHGLHEPVTLFEGKILDGRNRYRACLAAGADPRFVEYEGTDPLGYVVSLNLKRRHLNELQRAMVAARIANLAVGSNQHVLRITHNNTSGEKFDPPFELASANLRRPTAAEAERLLNVSSRSIETARRVIKQGAPELIEAVEHGKVAVSTAAGIASAPLEEQREIVARGRNEILAAAKAIRADESAKRRAEWTARNIWLSNHTAPLPSDRKYPIILADPPWTFEVYDEDSGHARAAAAHYPTMPLEEICALKVADLATPGAALFLWTTSPHLEEAFSVIAAWGFTYSTSLVWVKDKIGLGHWVRNQHEFLLVGARGGMLAPEPARRPPSVITAPRREHSRKPDEAYAFVERMYPDLPKIELFARNARPGWARWGNEAPGAAGDDGLAIPDYLRRAAP